MHGHRNLKILGRIYTGYFIIQGTLLYRSLCYTGHFIIQGTFLYRALFIQGTLIYRVLYYTGYFIVQGTLLYRVLYYTEWFFRLHYVVGHILYDKLLYGI